MQVSWFTCPTPIAIRKTKATSWSMSTTLGKTRSFPFLKPVALAKAQLPKSMYLVVFPMASMPTGCKTYDYRVWQVVEVC